RHTRSTRDWSSDVCSSDLASQTINFETGATLQTVNATVSSSAPFQYIVTILMENNGLCDVTPSLVSGCGSSSIPSPYLTTLAQKIGRAPRRESVDISVCAE